MLTQNEQLERYKAYATIFSAIAIPIVLTVAGYFIQRQLADESLKKDYVGIAVSILTASPKNQEQDLRLWAIEVLDSNSPIPFSKKAKVGLLSSGAIAFAGPAWIGPPESCRKKPTKRTVLDDFKKLDKLKIEESKEKAIELLGEFVLKVIEQEKYVLEDLNKLECVLDWADISEKSDNDYRSKLGLPSSKSIYENIRKESSSLVSNEETSK